jgi:hypothetical protein
MPVIRHQQLSTMPLRHGVRIFSYNVGKNSDRQAQTLKDARANDYDVFILQEPQLDKDHRRSRLANRSTKRHGSRIGRFQAVYLRQYTNIVHQTQKHRSQLLL